ncbi:unnamed protein product [Hermetia illucens]|uniref:Uncharacterized protein n=1 Tax=Hermetia illucens TaxID=343691 RepID=A0A7R8UKA8_HERIL|nr:UPF0193 protein EVG1 homolog [Hermetia illucens]CAD7082427.1 unnamed protein product [Hermetia illucens]
MEENNEWPSKRVAPGGLFHPAKVKYSKETHDLIKLLMEEAKLTMLQRKKMNYFLRNGEPLPPPIIKPPSAEKERLIALNMRRQERIPRRRTYDSIKDSGAFELPKYIPTPDSRESVEKAKLRLQETMSGTKLSPTSNARRKRERNEPKIIQIDPQDRINELMEQITERADWLTEMESLGEGKQYRPMIKSQIADRLREIKSLEKRLAKGKLTSEETTREL